MDDLNNAEIMPKTVRTILNIENKDIISLCKVGGIPLKKNKNGLTYFTHNDVETLIRLNTIQKRADELEEKSIRLKNELKKNSITKNNIIITDKTPNVNSILSNDEEHETIPENTAEQIVAGVPSVRTNSDDTVILLKQITGAVKNIENGIYDKFSEILESKLETKLEEKLGGIDEVIMDLVQAKTEYESLRKKITDYEKEVYSLKNELNKFRKIAGNIYIKEKKDNFEL